MPIILELKFRKWLKGHPVERFERPVPGVRGLTAEPLTALQVYMDPNEMFVCDVGDERGSGSDPRFCLHAGKVLRELRF